MPKDQDPQQAKQPRSALTGVVAGLFSAVLYVLAAIPGNRETHGVSDGETVAVLVLFPAIGATLGAMVGRFRRGLW